MATVTITIPDDKLNAAAKAYGFNLPEGGTATVAVKTAFVQEAIVNSIKNQMRQAKQQEIRQAAQEAANASAEDLSGIL
jgi:hypothetical protein